MCGAPSLLSPLSPHSSDRGRGWSKLCAINHVWHQHQGLQPWPWHCQMSVDTGGQTAAAVTAVNSSQQSFRHCSNPLSQVTLTWAQLSSPGRDMKIFIILSEWGEQNPICLLFVLRYQNVQNILKLIFVNIWMQNIFTNTRTKSRNRTEKCWEESTAGLVGAWKTF